LARHPHERSGFDRVKAMRSPTLEGALGRWDPEDYEFAFGCLTIHPALPLGAIEPPLWYLMPGD
jgi:hypothetical protein